MDIKYWGLDSLSKIGSVLGIPIKTDKYTRDKFFLKYARVLIEIQLIDTFLEYIEFVNEHNVAVRQKEDYEWKPLKCGHCKMFGHHGDDCRRKPQATQEWRPIIRQAPQEIAQLQPSTDVEGFITVRKKATTPVIEHRDNLHLHQSRTHLTA